MNDLKIKTKPFERVVRERRCIYLKCGCGCEEFDLLKQGQHTGMYCVKCGKWIKWANKNDINLINLKKEMKIRRK